MVGSEALIDIIRAQTALAQLGPDLGAVMELVAERVKHLTGSDGAIVELAEGEEMVYRAASGIAANQLGLRLRRNGSLSGLCVAEGEMLHCEDSETDARVDREACRRVGLRSMVVAPLKHGDCTVGVLKLAAAQANYFTAAHVEVLDLMCGLIAASMFHAVQHETSDLYHRATHDPLTGLANRALFYDRLRQGLSLARRRSARIGVLNLDMDGLKPINDTLGHRAGDAAICETGRRITGAVRQSDTVARLGGDEFAVIMFDIAQHDGAATHAGRLAEEIARPFVFEGHPIELAASIGVSTFPDDGLEIDQLVERADQAMYAVKRERKLRRA